MTDAPAPPPIGIPQTGPFPPPPAFPPFPAVATPPEPRWTSGRKLAFRLLFVLGGGILLLSLYGNVGLALVWRFTGVWWVLAQIGSYLTRGEGVDVVLSAGGDNMWTWCMHLGWIVVGLVIVAVWTALDRRRANYRSLLGLLGVLARFCLAISMIIYGVAKALPTQMGFMKLPAHQLQLTGDTSMFNTLWGFMGASTPYMVVTGLVELTAGILLLWRRTSLIGALLAVVAMGQVFLLNLFYDVPVKLVAGELFIVAVALTARFWPNLLRVALNLPGAAPVPPLPVAGTRRKWVRVTGLVAKFAVAGLMLMVLTVQGALMVYVINTPRSPLDGVWRATSFTIDGAPAGLTQRGPAPWSNLAITLRGNDTNEALKTVSTIYDSVVTQDPSGYTTAWQLERKGDLLELRKREGDAPLRLTTRLEGGLLHVSATVEGKRVEGVYERRFMERDRTGFRLIQPDDAGPAPASTGDQHGS